MQSNFVVLNFGIFISTYIKFPNYNIYIQKVLIDTFFWQVEVNKNIYTFNKLKRLESVLLCSL